MYGKKTVRRARGSAIRRGKNYKPKYSRKSTGSKPTPTKGTAYVPTGYQILNTIKPMIYRFKDTFQLNDIVGAGVAVAGLNVFSIKDIIRYGNLTSMFRQYRITNVKLRFRLNNVELTDNAQLPTLYCKYNYDPDLQTAAVTEDYMLRQSNVIVKQFHHNTIQGSLLEYNVKPCIFRATMLYPGVVGTATYMPSPVWNSWVDLDPSTTVNEAVYYGLQYYITNLPTGITINLDGELSYECRDLI